jgi:hypothetical protein
MKLQPRIIYTYGFLGETIHPSLINALKRSHFKIIDISGLCLKEIQVLSNQILKKKILLTSAHPYVPEYKKNTSYHFIAELNQAVTWSKVIYVSHDPIEEFKFEELNFVNEYDAFIFENPLNYEFISKLKPVFKFIFTPEADNITEEWQSYKAIFFPSELNHYENLGFDHFLKTFPFLLSTNIAVKFSREPRSDFLAGLNSINVKVIPSKVDSRLLITSLNCLFITNGSCGVVAECFFFNKFIYLVNDLTKSKAILDSIQRKYSNIFLISANELLTKLDKTTINKDDLKKHIFPKNNLINLITFLNS